MFMPAGTDLTQILLFPVKDSEARKHFLIGCAIVLAGFIVPIIPYLLIFGYAAQIVRQIFDGEEPRMTAWDNWGGLFQDGARMFGVRLVYILPILLIAFPMFLAGVAMPIIMENVNSSEVDAVMVVFALVMLVFGCLLTLLSLPLGLVIPAAEMRAVTKNEFAAGFRFRKWWGIFRANLGGFIAAFAIFYALSMLLGVVIQIMVATLILACLLPFVIPAVSMYSMLMKYAMFAQAYKVGMDKLA